MAPRLVDKSKEKWRNLRNTAGFKNAMLFLVFVCVSTIFWFILALNDSAQNHFNVALRIVNRPDSITFISEVPEKIHIIVSDKGTNLWRNGFLKKPAVNVDFKEYSSDGVLKYSYNDLISALRETFGSSAVITSVSLDSLQLFYTSEPGKKVPVVINAQVTPASGSTLEGNIIAEPAHVLVYGTDDVLDTIHFVSTEPLIMRNIAETSTVNIKLQKLHNARAIPSQVELTIPIEPLVMKEAMVSVEAVNVPEGEELLLFPSKVPVEYYVAMSRLNDDEDNNIKLVVNYEDIPKSTNGKLPIEISSYPERLKNLHLRAESIEYAIVKE